MRTFLTMSRFGLLTLVGSTMILPAIPHQPAKPYKVSIVEDNAHVGDGSLSADPKHRLEYRHGGNMEFGIGGLTRNANSASTLLMIDGKIQAPVAGKLLQDLPQRPPGIQRHGGQSVWERDGIRVTMALEAIRSKGMPGTPLTRRLNTLLVKYSIENRSDVVRKVGCRAIINASINDNDGPLFASPISHPNLVLNRYLFRNQDVPLFVELLQRPDLRDPGLKGIFTFKLGETLEGPDKVVLTSADVVRRDQWDVRTERVSGRSACALFWEPRDLEPNAKRELAFAYGQGIAAADHGNVTADFGGSFAPGKSFTITARVRPIDGQSLTLQLPQGIELIHGRSTQLVPPAAENQPSVVVWHCRLAGAGTYPVSIRSNHGMTQTWTVTVSPPNYRQPPS